MPIAVEPEALRVLGHQAGLSAVGICRADDFPDVAATLHERKRLGLHGDMQFTYRNPARSTSPRRTVESAESLIVGAMAFASSAARIDDRPDPADGPHGSIGAYAWRDYYADLRAGLGVIADHLKEAGHEAVVVADDNALVDRAAAVRSGIGWWGKNTNVLLPGRGSNFVLGAVVTSAPLAVDAPVKPSCGSCSRCLSGCPTGALIEPGVLDARRCLAWLLQLGGMFPRDFRVALGDRVYGCDDCQEVCPPNRESPVALRGDEVQSVPLSWLLSADDEAILAAHGRWYIPNREVDGVRRNALIAWANTVAVDADDCEPLLRRFLEHPNPMLVGHAVWAARRLGRGELADEVVNRRGLASDDLVAAELAATDVTVRT